MKSAVLTRRGLALALLLAACGGPDSDPAPTWQPLARGFRPPEQAPDWQAWDPGFPDGPSLRIAAESGGTGTWVELPIERADWRPSYAPGMWQARRPIWNLGFPQDGSPSQTLEAEGRRFEYVPYEMKVVDVAELEPGSFSGVIESVYLYLEEGEEPPREATYRCFVTRGTERDGAWRVNLARFHAEGLPVWPGESVERACSIPPASRLSFATAAMASQPEIGATGELLFRVLLDGEPLHEVRQEVSDLAEAVNREVALPPEGRDDARLTFEVVGAPAVSAFLRPVIGPADFGRPGARPWKEERPDLVLFLADTFRADNMALYGGEHDVTPELDRFAEECVRFRRAWSPGSWTLPSQASMLTGLFPYQHGAYRKKRALPAEVATITELLAGAGYRTGAVTESVIVSERFGFDQGFEWFDERVRQVEDTLEAARTFLDADDGRPTFLFLQTYRTHSPFKATEEARQALAGRVAIEGDWRTLRYALHEELLAWAEEAGGWSAENPMTPAVEEGLDALYRLYLGGVWDLDQAFAGFRGELTRRGYQDHGYLVFTSDHGEAFGEHLALFHGNGVWEANVRIPLLVFGHDLEPRDVERPVTLVDLPQTLAQLADLPPDPQWRGHSLVDPDAPVRPAISLIASDRSPQEWAALADGEDRKLILESVRHQALGEARLVGAFDLAGDPHEEAPLEAEWIETFLDEHRSFLDESLAPLFRPRPAQLSEADLAELAAMGYGGLEADE